MKKKDALPRKLTDHQLYALLKKGHPTALEYIHVRYKRLLFWLGKQMLKDDFVVETLVQEVFLKLWLHRDSIETPQHMVCFLRFVLKRECIAYFNAPKTQFTRLTVPLNVLIIIRIILPVTIPSTTKSIFSVRNPIRKILMKFKKCYIY